MWAPTSAVLICELPQFPTMFKSLSCQWLQINMQKSLIRVGFRASLTAHPPFGFRVMSQSFEGPLQIHVMTFAKSRITVKKSLILFSFFFFAFDVLDFN